MGTQRPRRRRNPYTRTVVRLPERALSCLHEGVGATIEPFDEVRGSNDLEHLTGLQSCGYHSRRAGELVGNDRA